MVKCLCFSHIGFIQLLIFKLVNRWHFNLWNKFELAFFLKKKDHQINSFRTSDSTLQSESFVNQNSDNKIFNNSTITNPYSSTDQYSDDFSDQFSSYQMDHSATAQRKKFKIFIFYGPQFNGFFLVKCLCFSHIGFLVLNGFWII